MGFLDSIECIVYTHEYMRIEPRFPFQVPVALLRSLASGARQEVVCRLENLSKTGLRIQLRSANDLAQGEQVYLTLTIRESVDETRGGSPVTVSLTADVIWRREHDCGLRILSINESDLSLYQNLIDAMKA